MVSSRVRLAGLALAMRISDRSSVYEAFSTASRELFGDKYARLRPAQRDDGRIVDDAQWRQSGSNRVGDVIRREMRVVLFRDARVGVAELNGDHAHRNGPPGQSAGVRVPQDMERRRRIDLGAGARFLKGPLLVRLTPSSAIISDEHRVAG